MTNKVEEKRGRPAYKNGGKGGGWQRLSSQLASTFDRAIELHGGKEALAVTLSEEISQRPLGGDASAIHHDAQEYPA
jgi:hypothetical protein